MKAGLTMNASKRLCLIIMVLFGCPTIINGQAEVEGSEEESREFEENFVDEEAFYEWSIWSPCSRTCGIGIQFRGQICLRENKALCVEKPIIYQTCNTQACPPGGTSFRDLQCGMYDERDIFINGERAKWMSYVRGDNHCLLFCYPYGGELFYYFGKAKDGTQCSKEPHGVCVRGRCKPVGCDNVLESGVHLDKCRVCGGNSTTCEPISGRIERSPTQFEKMSGYAEVMVIPKGSTSVFLTDETWNYLALRRQNGDYVVNGHRIVNWPGLYKVGDVDVQYKRFSDNIKETIQISGPTQEDIYVTGLLITGKLNTSFEYWKLVSDNQVSREEDFPLEGNHLDLLMEWGSWTACSATCGGGIKVRARRRHNGAVSSFRGRETDVQRCNDVPCDKMTAEWSKWGQWDDCSASCGGGARIRFRYCKKPNSSDATSGCPGERYAVELCNVQECPTEETRPITSDIERNETVSSLQIVHLRDSTGTSSTIHPIFSITPGETFSESYKTTWTASSAFSSIFSIQYPISSKSSKLNVREEKPTIRPMDSVLRPGDELFSSSSQNTLHFSAVLSFFESSMKESKTAYESDMLTTKHKVTSVLPGKSQGLGTESSDVNQKISESSFIEQRNMSTSRVDQNMITPTSTQRSRTSTETSTVTHMTSIYTKHTAVITVPVVRPSPISMDRFTTIRQLKLPTFSTELVTSLKTDPRIRSDVVTLEAVSDSGSERSSQAIASGNITFLDSIGNVKISSSLMTESITSQEPKELEISLRMSTEAQLSSSIQMLENDGKDSTASLARSITRHAIRESTSVISSTLQEATLFVTSHHRDSISKTSIPDGLHSTIGRKTSSFVTDVLVATPFSILEKAMLIYSSLLSITTISAEYKTSETVKEHKSLRPSMATDPRIPLSQVMETREQSSVLLEPDFATPTLSESHFSFLKAESTFPALNYTVIKHYEPRTSTFIGAKLYSGIDLQESGHGVLETVGSSSYIHATMTKIEKVESAGTFTGRFKEATETTESILATKTTMPLKIKTLSGVWPSISSIASVNVQRLKPSRTYDLPSNVSKSRHEIKSRLSISSALPLGVETKSMTKNMYSLWRHMPSSLSPRISLTNKEEGMTTHTESLTSSSAVLSHTRSAQTQEAISSQMESLASSLSRKPESSPISPSLTSVLKEDAMVTQMEFLTSSSSRQPILSPMSQQFTSALKDETTTTRIDFVTLPSSSKRIVSSMSTLLSTAQTGEDESTSARQYTPSMSSPLTSELLTSQMYSVSRQPTQLSTTAHFSSALKGESLTKYTHSVSSLTASSSSQPILSLHFSSKQKGEALTTYLDSVPSSSSMELILSSLSPHFALKAEAIPTNKVSFTSLLPRQPTRSLMSPDLSSTMTQEAITGQMDSSKGTSTRRRMQLSISHSNSILIEALPSNLDSPARSSSKQPMVSAIPANFSSVPKEDATTSFTDVVVSSSSKQPVISSFIPHLSSTIEDEETLTAQMKSTASLLSRKSMPSRMPWYVNLTMKADIMTTPVDDFARMSSRQSMPSSEESITSHMDSLPCSSSALSRKSMKSSVFAGVSSAPEQGAMSGQFDLSAKTFSRQPKISSMTTNFISSLNKEGTISSRINSTSVLSFIQHMPLSVPPHSVMNKAMTSHMFSITHSSPWPPISSSTSTYLSSVMIEEFMITYMNSFSSSSSTLFLLPSSMYPHLSFTTKEGMLTRKDYLKRSLSTQPTPFSVSPSFRSTVDETAMTSHIIRPSSRQEMMSSKVTQLSSVVTDEATISNMNSSASSSARPSMSSSLPPHFSSMMKEEAITSQQPTPTPISAHFTSVPKGPMTTNKASLGTTPMFAQLRSAIREETMSPNLDSLTTSLIMQPMSLSISLDLGLAMKEEATSSHVNYLAKLMSNPSTSSSMSTQFVSALQEESMSSHMDSLSASSSRKATSSEMSPHYRSVSKGEAEASHVDSLATLSSSLMHLQLRSVLRDEAITSLVDTLPSSSSRTPSSSSLSPHSSSSLTEVSASSFSRQPMQSSVSPHLTSAVKVEATNTHMHTLASSLSRKSSPSSMSTNLKSSLKEEVINSLVDVLSNLTSKQPLQSSMLLRFSSAINETITTSQVNLLAISSSSEPMPLAISSQFSSAMKEKFTTTHIDYLATSSSRQPTPSSMSSYLGSSLNEKVLTSLVEFLPGPSSRQPILSSISPHLSSALNNQVYSATRLLSIRHKPSSISSEFSLTLKDELMTGHVHSVTGSSMLLLKTSTLPLTFLVSIPKSSISTEVGQPLFSTLLTLQSSIPKKRYHESSSSYRASPETSSASMWLTTDERRLTSLAKVHVSSSMTLSDIKQQIITTTGQTLSMASSALEGGRLKLVTSNLKPTSVNEAAAPASTTIPAEKQAQCPPCDLSQRLKEKYCYSDYAILVRVRSEAIINGSQTLHFSKVKNVFKNNRPMKKKLEIRFHNKDCNCKAALLLKRDYFVFGNHVAMNGTVSFLEVDRQSFVSEWDVTLEKEMEQMEDYCSRNSMVPTPRLATSLQFTKTKMFPKATSQISTLIERPATSWKRTKAPTAHLAVTYASTELSVTTTRVLEPRCGPCENRIKRTRAYCTSDFVVHVKILTEAINELSLDTNYRVRLIHIFKMTSSLSPFRSVWILSNMCHCPLLLPGKQYLLMGRLTTRVGSTKTIAEISRESYVEEWKGSMVRRMPELKKRCPLTNTTQMTTLSRTKIGSTPGLTEKAIPSTTETRTEEIAEVTSEPPTSPSTAKPPVKCRRCRISKKRNRSYCESDFVIRARILQSSFNDSTQERKYLVKIITLFRSVVELKERQEIFVDNDYCQCPNLALQEQYVIMGTAEQISVSKIRLLIPQRPFVKTWQSNMEARFKTMGDICDN